MSASTAAHHHLSALGDSRRREILHLLAGGTRSVTELAEQLPVTRPAVSQHLRVLEKAGLVNHRREGTRHLYRLDVRGLAALRSYLDSLWEQALLDLKSAAERTVKHEEER